ncbi:hypothetical protein L3X38_023502 [Prunus dulcis]|uniref:non-specific serine/threonine protein kinase n=1 Tax=Prunus dulcis TaxID=3755 RepID=A0AAD4VYW2_PRUDU|nr:hypothetical protein L3X38_023502 [Prunus dulcis]
MNNTIWSSTSSQVAEDPVAQLLENGNLVVREKATTDSESYIWESFNLPSDTLLPEMKLGWNFRTGLNRFLTSWKNASDPSPGEYTYGVDNVLLPQLVIAKGSKKMFRTGPWNGLWFTAASGHRRNSLQNDECNSYGEFGANGICRISKSPICECLHGFVPKSPDEWGVLNWTSGCIREIPLSCQKREGFLKVRNVKLPDQLNFLVNNSSSNNGCEAECLKNCSCVAYANTVIINGGSSCLMWFGDLVDLREFVEEDSQQDIYIRLPHSELASRGTKEDLELPLFDFDTIAAATNNFSYTNKLGEGGFGPVYKAKLTREEFIAVKRHSKDSGHGIKEFKNEVAMIANLQHWNLVKLLGCCIQGEERMLIYEYMPNKSLDCFIFNQNRKVLLNWPKRLDIIMGIARGLLYLHQDFRLRIIHRDLKSSNMLLDDELNPKISDFGIARIFGRNQAEAKTKRVIGTYGYMSPEYAIDGKFSVKSDVFSFGVLLLELVSGRKNRGFHHPDHHHSLLGHAWLLWNKNKELELMDECLEDSYVEFEVQRCIQVGLLCVQKMPADRPAMSSVVFMLGNEGATLPQPKEPGFFIERSFADIDTLLGEVRSHTGTTITITAVEAR